LESGLEVLVGASGEVADDFPTLAVQLANDRDIFGNEIDVESCNVYAGVFQSTLEHYLKGASSWLPVAGLDLG